MVICVGFCSKGNSGNYWVIFVGDLKPVSGVHFNWILIAGLWIILAISFWTLIYTQNVAEITAFVTT